MSNNADKVWIVMGHIDYESDRNLKAFRSEKKAKALCDLLREHPRYEHCNDAPCEHKQFAGYDGYSVAGMEVEE